MSHNNTILVLGAGELGMPMLRSLAARARATTGVSITVLLRASTIDSVEPRKRNDVAELRSLGIDLQPGDLVAASATDLAAQFARFDTVISCTGFSAGPGVQRKLARAVLDAGVKRYFPWQFGVDYDVIGRGSAQDLFDEQLDVRDMLRAQHRTEWVIVSTGMFTSFLFEPSFGVVDFEHETVHALGDWDNAVTVTTPEDIGALTARIVLAEPRIANEVVFIAGETITYRRLADLVDIQLGREVKRIAWSVPMLKGELAKEPGDTLRKYRVVFAEGRGVAWDLSTTFNTRHRLETVDVQAWMRRHLSIRTREHTHAMR
jgi:hypothetical protein